MENKKEGDDLFDRLNTSILNEYLSSLMPGTANGFFFNFCCTNVHFIFP